MGLRKKNLKAVFLFTLFLLLGINPRAVRASITFGGNYYNSTTVIVGNSTVGTLTIDGGSILSNQDSFISYTAGAGSSSVTITSGTWASSGNLSVGFNSIGTLTINSGGFVSVGDTLSKGGSSTITLNSGTLQIGLGGVTGTLATNLANNSGTVIFNRSDNSTYSYILIGAGNLTKNGTGTLSMNGTNTYTGATTINAGVLQVSGTGSLGSGAYAGNIADGGTLVYSSSAAQTLSGNISGNGGLTKDTATSTLILTGSNTYSGPTSIEAGVLQIGAGGTTGNLSANSSINVGTNGTLVFNRTDIITQGTQFSTEGITGTGNLTQNGTGTVVLTAANTYTGATRINAGTLQLGNGSTTGSLSANGTILNNGSLVFNRTDTVTQGTDFSAAAITGTGSLTKNGTGTLVLNANNTYTGATTLNSGTLSISSVANGGNASNIGSASTAATNLVLGNGTLLYTGGNGSTDRAFTLTAGTNTTIDVVNSAATLTFTGAAVTTTGGITKNGSGTLALSGANLYSGTTTLNAGTLAINNASGIGTSTLKINGGTIDNTSGSAKTLSTTNVQQWSGDFAFAGTGDLNFGAGAGAVTMTASRILNILAGNLTVGGAISGATFGLTKNGNGTLILSAANTYTGATTINAGTLNVTTLANGGSGSGKGSRFKGGSP
jgi:autotransporter-associated beta strand protein